MKVYLFAWIKTVSYGNKFGSYIAFSKSFNDALEAFKSEVDYTKYEVIEITESLANNNFIYKGNNQ